MPSTLVNRWVLLNRLTLAATLTLTAPAANAQILAQYTFTDSALTTNSGRPLDDPNNWASPTTVAAGLGATPVQSTGSSGSVNGGFAAGADSLRFLVNGGATTTPALAVSNNQFFQFTLTPVGTTLNLTSLTFDAARGSNSTRGFVVRTSLDGFAADIATSDVTGVQPTFEAFAIPLSEPVFQSVSSPVTIRVYTYVVTGGTNINYDNITLNGSVVIVPESGTLALVWSGAALFGVGMTWRQRRRMHRTA